ncbi:MAG: Phosphoenolpyruvate synthase [Parcubacteria group bacterium GW2011_GWB1_46_8]|nr:MAG: Phosphoenolpyruvate synthase [Parcubacteria group bacterium GW2011_GWB1_46_8]
MDFIKSLREIDRTDVPRAGGKGASLGELAKMGVPVPTGFVVLASTFEQFFKETDVNTEVDAMWKRINIKDNESIEESSEIIRNLILAKQFPEKIAGEISSAFDKLRVSLFV